MPNLFAINAPAFLLRNMEDIWGDARKMNTHILQYCWLLHRLLNINPVPWEYAHEFYIGNQYYYRVLRGWLVFESKQIVSAHNLSESLTIYIS